ncbi:transglutaminase domain-containing protein, partial [Candidatus Poribacteria bacterium]|nr:transglutaminase domain-containing protein [Candidatus Poribacteria bacterium]
MNYDPIMWLVVKKLRVIAIAVLIAFTAQSLNLELLRRSAYAEEPPPPPPSENPVGDADKLFENIEKTIRSISDELAASQAYTTEMTLLETQKATLDGLEPQIVSQLDSKRAELVTKSLPALILSRHDSYASGLQQKIDSVQQHMTEIIAQKEVPSALDLEIQEAINYFEMNFHRPATGVDTETLPHRDSNINKEGPLAFRHIGRRTMLAYAGSSINNIMEGVTSPLPLTGVPVEADSNTDYPEVAVTPEIEALAEMLENNPVKIYQYVHDNFKYEPYYGLIKNAHLTLMDGAGNDADLASLLITLLRASGYPARYVYGTINLPIELAEQLIGIEDPNLVLTAFLDNNIPAELVTSGGQITGILIDHAWVRVYLDAFPYRGAYNIENEAWVTLDPSFKFIEYVPSREVADEVGVDPVTFLQDITLQAVVDAANQYATGLPHDFIIDRLLEWGGDVQAFAGMNGLEPVELFRTQVITGEEYGILPLSLPYTVNSLQGAFSQLPSTVKYQVEVEVEDVNGLSLLSYSTDTVSLAGKRVTLSYAPATADDAAVMNAYRNETEMPAYIVDLKPRLIVEDHVVATGPSVSMGYDQRLKVTFTAPFGNPESVTDLVRAGSYNAIALNLQNVSGGYLEERLSRLADAREGYERGSSFITRDDLIGETLNCIGLNYFYQVDKLNEITAGSLGVLISREPSMALVSYELKRIGELVDPYTATAPAVTIDVDRDVYIPISTTGSPVAENQFLITSALASSALEHICLEQSLRGTAISTVRMIQAANETFMPIYTIDSANINSVLPNLVDMS